MELQGRNARLLRVCGMIATAAMILLAHVSTTRAQFADPPAEHRIRPELLKEVEIDQKLNDSVPLDLMFKDEHGNRFSLRNISAASR